MGNRLISHIAKNKKLYLLLLISYISFVCCYCSKFFLEQEIYGWIRLWKYLSLIVFFFSSYLLFVQAKRILLSNLVLLVLLLFLTELTLFFVQGMLSAYYKNFQAPNIDSSSYLAQVGLIYSPDTTYRDILVKEGDTVFDVLYHIDSYNKRITPDFDSTKSEYALFFGCSIGFGYGLDDNQTLPYFVQKQSGANAYNFCVSGTGTNHMLAQLQARDLSKQVREKEGTAYYIFFWDHIRRSIGSMNRYAQWLHYTPYYQFEGKKLVRNKMFTNGRPCISYLYEKLYQTNIVTYFQLDFPLKLNDQHFNLVTEMISESQRTYVKQFGNQEFYVVFYPQYMNYTEEEMKIFQSYLRKKQIKFIDLSKKMTYHHEHTLKGDDHPNAETNKLVATTLLSELKKN